MAGKFKLTEDELNKVAGGKEVLSNGEPVGKTGLSEPTLTFVGQTGENDSIFK